MFDWSFPWGGSFRRARPGENSPEAGVFGWGDPRGVQNPAKVRILGGREIFRGRPARDARQIDRRGLAHHNPGVPAQPAAGRAGQARPKAGFGGVAKFSAGDPRVPHLAEKGSKSPFQPRGCFTGPVEFRPP